MQEENIAGNGNSNWKAPNLAGARESKKACVSGCKREGKRKQGCDSGQGSVLGRSGDLYCVRGTSEGFKAVHCVLWLVFTSIKYQIQPNA